MAEQGYMVDVCTACGRQSPGDWVVCECGTFSVEEIPAVALRTLTGDEFLDATLDALLGRGELVNDLARWDLKAAILEALGTS